MILLFANNVLRMKFFLKVFFLHFAYQDSITLALYTKELYIIFACWAVNKYTCYGVFFQSLSGRTNATLNCKTGLFFNVFLIKLLDLDQAKKGPIAKHVIGYFHRW